ncbi:MAG: flagellar filament capping protein FliD [Pusillimonas sp.]|nr:flagellar filament capping protein FliD [Pusillimonas sp.]
MAISAIGVGSGLPLDQLLNDLRASENIALQQIKSQQTVVQNRISAYGKIKSAFESFQKAGEALGNPDTFGAYKAGTSAETFTATANNGAISGQYNITVESLASTQTLVAQGLGSRTDANGTNGVITFTFGDGTTKTLDLTGKDTSINGIIEAINSDDSLGIQATVLNDGSTAPYRLMLSSTATGTDAALTQVEVNGNTDGVTSPMADLMNFGVAGSTVQEQAAKNAEITVNGITITSQTNTIENAIEGVKLNLAEANPGVISNLSVSRDDGSAKSAVEAFVKSYNVLQNTIKSLTAYDVENQSASALTGDSMARRIQNQAREVVNVFSTSGEVRTLSQMGITTNLTTGELTIDQDKLSAALSSNIDDVKNLLSGPMGLTTRLEQAAQGILDTSGGLIASATNGAKSISERLQQQYESTSARIDSRMENYRRQFSALDGMLSQMNSLSSYLTQQLGMLENLSTGNKK